MAAALVAIDPLLLNQSALVMTETLATLLATASLFALSGWSRNPSFARAMVAGLVLGLACLCRPTFIPWLGLSAWRWSSFNANQRRGWGRVFEPPAMRQEPSAMRQLGARRLDPGHPVRLPTSTPLQRFAIQSASRWRSCFPHCSSFRRGCYETTTSSEFRKRRQRTAATRCCWGTIRAFIATFARLRAARPGIRPSSAEAWELRRFSSSPNDAIWNFPHTTSDVPQTPPIKRSELEDDEFAYSLTRRYMADEPEMFVLSSLFRVSRLWQLVPYRTSQSESTVRLLLRCVTGCWYSVLFVLSDRRAGRQADRDTSRAGCLGAAALSDLHGHACTVLEQHADAGSLDAISLPVGGPRRRLDFSSHA